jgi:hypothetical protein
MLRSFSYQHVHSLKRGSYDRVEYSTEVTLKLNGRDRTLRLDRLEELGTFFDITDDVIFDGDTMHPTFQSVHEQAQSILDGIYAQIEENSGPR